VQIALTTGSLSAQWVKQDADIARAEGRKLPELGADGRLYTDEAYQEWKGASTRLGYGDFVRSREIAEFFHENNLKLPDEDSALWSSDVDYEDVKLKIIQQEGLDLHDFHIFDTVQTRCLSLRAAKKPRARGRRPRFHGPKPGVGTAGNGGGRGCFPGLGGGQRFFLGRPARGGSAYQHKQAGNPFSPPLSCELRPTL
jgi:hypothetical protein